MGRVLPRNIAFLPAVFAAIWASAEAGEPVALRVAGGRFLQATEEGAVRADRLFPAQRETFELVPCEDGHIALKACDGRFLVAEGRDARSLRADSPRVEPGDRETFVLLPAGEHRVAMKARNYRDFVVFDGGSTTTPEPQQADEPRAQQTVGIYRAAEIPPLIRSGLALAISALVMQELAGKEYDKVETRKQEKFIELPAPTLRNPRRKKRHQVLGIREEYHINARLDGPPDIQITRMPYLKSYPEGGSRMLMFQVQARVPARGRVRYKIPNALSASSGFRAVVELAMVGEVRAEKSDDQVALGSPELLDFRAKLGSLDLSNDVLHAMHRQIEDVINHVLRKKQDRIRQQANQALRKAVETHELRHPLLRYLSFP